MLSTITINSQRVFNLSPISGIDRTSGRQICCRLVTGCSKKNQNASRPSEHPPVRGGECQNVYLVGGIKGCKNKTSSWHSNGFPDRNSIGSTVQCRGEAHRYTVHLDQPPCRNTRKTVKTKQKQCSEP